MLESAGGWSGQILVWCEQMETVLIVCSVLGLAAISGMTLFFLVEGKGDMTVTYDSLKAGTIRRSIALR